MRKFPEEAGINRFGKPEEIADLLGYLVSPAAKWMTGAWVRMDGGEIKGILASAGFRIIEVMPVGLGPDGLLPRRWLCGRLRAYGYLLAARRANDV